MERFSLRHPGNSLRELDPNVRSLGLVSFFADLVAARTKPEQQGLAFGLHRSMDTLGAVLGPLFALALVEAHVSLRWIFVIAVVPGFLSVLLILWLVKEYRVEPRRNAFRLSLPASPAFRWLLAGSLLFAVGNSSDMFILLKAKDVGMSTAAVILLYALYNVTGLATFAASTVGGLLWSAIGPWATFAYGARPSLRPP